MNYEAPQWMEEDAKAIFNALAESTAITGSNYDAVCILAQSYADYHWAVDTIRKEGRLIVGANKCYHQHPAEKTKKEATATIAKFLKILEIENIQDTGVEIILDEQINPETT